MVRKLVSVLLGISIITILTACSSNKKINNTYQSINISSAELHHIGTLIFRNETGNKRDNLLFWNTKEEFPSLGIGHFIWYPKAFSGSFPDSFPGLTQFYQSKGIRPPSILLSKHAPWPNRDAFEQARARGELNEAIIFLESTKALQVEFIAQRLNSALAKMMDASNSPQHVKYQFDRMLNSKNGLYPLIDYINFKGEGGNTIPEYHNVGWGLRQVLEGMKGSQTGEAAFHDFTRSCMAVLSKRVKNQPNGKNEQTFLPGWHNRCKTYTTDTVSSKTKVKRDFIMLLNL